MAKFKVGDLVMLKSKSPAMTVNSIRESTSRILYDCKWFVGAKSHADLFAEDALEAYVAPAKGGATP